MSFTFTKATRKQARARLAFAGPSGSGKTTWALITATRLAGGTVEVGPVGYITDMSNATGRVAVIDTERGSASLYADQFDFDVLEFPAPYSPARLQQAIRDAAAAGYASVVIDGLTPFWNGEGGVLDIVDAAAAKLRGNTYMAWKEGTPAQNMLIAAMLEAPLHVVATVRSKQEYVQEKQGDRTIVRKVGMAPEQRQGLEYEFTVVADVDLDHQALASKTRCPLLADRLFRKGDAVAFADTFAGWLNSGDEQPMATDEVKAEIRELAGQAGLSQEQLAAGIKRYAGVSGMDALTEDGGARVVAALRVAAEKAAAKAAATQATSPADEDPYAVSGDAA